MNTIEKNLYEFYRVFGSVKNTGFISGDEYKMVYSEDKSWPQMIFNLNQASDPQKLIPLISSEIKAPYFVTPENYISRNHADLLKANAIIPVKILTGMNITPERNESIVIPPECKIRELTNEKHLVDFAHLIRKEFIASEMTFKNELLAEINHCKEIQMTGLFSGNTLASSLLVLKKENIAGLYFIVTRKEYQNNGYATILIKFILNRLYNEGVKEVVLHANHYSFGLYKKIGFVDQNRFIIYKKL